MALSDTANFFSNQLVHYKEHLTFYTNEQFNNSQNVTHWNEYSYKAEYETDGKSFKLFLTPKNYGKDANLSFYADSLSENIYGGDHKGEKASANDPVVYVLSDGFKEKLRLINNK